MKTVCAWCECVIESGGFGNRMAPSVTHGICADCAENVLFQEGVPLAKLLENIPVRVIFADHRSTELNPIASNRSPDLTAAYQGNESLVFECAHSRRSHGCGTEIHCSGCTIRSCVLSTYRTGETHDRVPAYLRGNDKDNPDAPELLVSTCWMGNSVVLVIEPNDKVRKSEHLTSAHGHMH